jgi:hypothetical protein
MSIKSFKQYIEEGTGSSGADNFVAPKDDDREATEYMPRSKGEQDFAAMHKMTHTKHPVAGDHQFNGDRSEIREETEQLDESDALAKKVAQHAASAHKSLKVTSHGNEHYVHRKDDPDGEDGYIMVKHDNGKFHVSSESGVAGGGTKSFGNHEDAAAHAHKIASS